MMRDIAPYSRFKRRRRLLTGPERASGLETSQGEAERHGACLYEATPSRKRMNAANKARRIEPVEQRGPNDRLGRHGGLVTVADWPVKRASLGSPPIREE
jgi:hypothetical protein